MWLREDPHPFSVHFKIVCWSCVEVGFKELFSKFVWATKVAVHDSEYNKETIVQHQTRQVQLQGRAAFFVFTIVKN